MSSTLNQNLSDSELLVLEAFTSGGQQYATVYQEILNLITPERAPDEKFSVHAQANGVIQEVAEGAAFPDTPVVEIGSKTITNRIFKHQVSLTKEMREFDNYGVVMAEASKTGYNGRVIQDQIGADLFNNAEGTTTTWDGLSLANSAHLIGVTGLTQSNVVTGGFSTTSVNSCLTRLMQQKDQSNITTNYQGRYLVVPPALNEDAYQLINSTDDPSTANRAINWNGFRKLQLVVWPLLTSSTDYHVLADKMFHRLMYGFWIDPAVDVTRDPVTGNTLYQYQFDANAGAVDYLGYIFGNAA